MRVRTQLSGSAAVAEAIRRGDPLRRVVVRSGGGGDVAALVERARAAGIPVERVSERCFQRLRSREDAGEVLALVGPPPDATSREVLAGDGVTWHLLGVAYPGNAGSAVRTAEVSGAAGVFVDTGFDHDQRRAVLRAAMRADRFMPVFFESAESVLDAARRAGRAVLAVEATGDAAPWEVDLTGRLHVVVGGEADGVPAEVLARCSRIVRIPMSGFVPSYNLQAAVAAVAVERMRQIAGATT